MIVKKTNPWREKIISKLLGLIYRLDNTGSGNFEKNGEENFINQFVESNDKQPLIIFDVGANVGDYSQLLKDKLKTRKNYSLHLFEPQKSCFYDLKKRFDGDNIIINNFGLSDSAEKAIVYKNEDKSEITSLYKRNLKFYNFDMDKQEEIELRKASDYIKESGIKHINLLKIDVEGHEIKALSGFGEYLNSNFIDYIQFEYGGANIDSHTNLLDFYNLLLPKGYKIAKIMPQYLELRDYNPRLDNFVYQNYVAISEKILEEISSEKQPE